MLHFALASCSAIIKIYLSHSDSFTSSPASIDGDLYVYNGWQFSITCSHNNTAVGVTRWTFSDLDSCVSISIDHFTSRNQTCGPFVFHNISGQEEETLNSTASADASLLLNGTDVECLDSAGTRQQVVGSTSIVVIGKLCLSNGKEYNFI